MAKKTKTVKKKAAVSTKKHHHHWHPHDFLLVVAGGFVIIILVFLLSGWFPSTMTNNSGADAQAAALEAEMNAQIEKTVTINEFSYSPDPLTVKKGTTVTWTNNDGAAHSATADDGTFDTGLLEKNESGSVTFSTPGVYTYHCAIHPNMTGKVIVEE